MEACRNSGTIRAIIAWVIISAGLSSAAAAATYQVGAGRTYTTINAVPALAAGDIVEIYSGTYNEYKLFSVSGTTTAPITIRGMGTTKPIIDGTGLVLSGVLPTPRALFQIDGNNYVIENLEFRNGHNADGSGDGIRVNAGHNVTIRNCYIHNCDMGIQSNDNDNFLIEYCEIASNGATGTSNPPSHNIYVNAIKVTMQYCYVHDALTSQNFKSRSHFSALICNYIADSLEGEVVLVDSSTQTVAANSNAVMIGNTLVSKVRPATSNQVKFVEFGQDNLNAHNGTLYAMNNTFIAGDPNITFIRVTDTGSNVSLKNNIFHGSNNIVGQNVGTVSGTNNWLPATATVPASITGSVKGSAPGFVNASGRDYHLTATSPCRNMGTASLTYVDGSGLTQGGTPSSEYVKHVQRVSRTSDGAIDAGQYEAAVATTSVGLYKTLELSFTAATSPANPFDTYLLKLRVKDPDGRIFFIDGFFDGDGNGGATGNVWKARITPYKVGTWQWQTVPGDADDAGLAGRSGTFDCAASGDVGGVVTDGAVEKEHFRFQDGEYMYPVGNFLDLNGPQALKSTHVYMSNEITDTDRNNIIVRQRDFHSANKMNVYFANIGDYSSLSVVPWTGTETSNDKTKMDLARWKTYDAYIQRFKDEKLLAEMWFFADDSNFGALSQADKNRLFRYAMARTSAYSHTMYVVCLEWDEGWTITDVQNSAAFIQSCNPWKRVLSVHKTVPQWDFHGNPNFDFIATQPGNNASDASVNSVAAQLRSQESIAHLSEEFGILNGDVSDPLRNRLWANFCGGAAGSGTGSDLKAFQRFINQSRVPFQRMSPNNALVGNSSGTTGVYCLAEVGEHYVVYKASTTGSITLDVAGTGHFGRWFNPRDPNATLTAPFTVNAGNGQVFTPPSNPTLDWVLWISKGNNLNTGTTHPTPGVGLVAQTVSSTPASPTVTLTSPTAGQSFNQGTVVSLAATATGNGGATITRVEFYDAEGGVLLGTDTPASYQFSWNTAGVAPGTHKLTAEAVDSNGSRSVSRTVAVTITANNSAPTISTFTATPATVKTGTVVTYTLTASDSDAVDATLNYSIDVDSDGTQEFSGTIASGSTKAHTYTFSTTGNRTATAKVTDSVPQSTIRTAAVSVVPAINSADPRPTPTSGAAPLLVTCSGTAQNGIPPYTNFRWDFGDGSAVVNGGNDQTHTYNSAGTYTITLTVTDSTGDTATGTRTITVTPGGGGGGTLVGWWKLDEATGTQASDSSGNNYHGALSKLWSSSLPTWQPAGGKIAGAVELAGDDDFVSIPATVTGGQAPLLQIQGAMTLSAWVRLDAFASGETCLMSKSGNIPTGWQLNLDSNHKPLFKIGVNNGAAWATVTGNTVLTTGAWTLVTGVFDATANPPALKVYVNGALDGTNAAGIPSTQYNADRNILLGVMINNGWVDGRLDDVRVYSSALSAQQVSDLFNGVTSSNNPPSVSSVSAMPNPANVSELVTFTAAASDPDGDTLSYSWNFGDSTSGSGATATHAYSAAGTYSATVTVSDGKGGSDSRSVSVTVNAADTAGPAITIGTPSNNGQKFKGSVAFSGTASDATGIAKIEWRIDGGAWTLASGTSNWSFTVPQPGTDGTHTVDVRGTDTVAPTANVTTPPVSRTFVSDNTAPVISSLTQTKTSSSATITWTADEGSDSRVRYGTASGNYTSDTGVVQTNVLSHSVGLSGLSPSTTYFYVAMSTDSVGNTRSSAEQSFTTDAAPTGPNPVAWWKLDESTGTTVTDSSPNHYNGSLQTLWSGRNSTWQPSGGKIGGALEMLGSDDFVSVPASGGAAPLLQIQGAMTLSAWVKLDTLGNGDTCIMSKSGNIPSGWQLNVDGNHKASLKIGINNGAAWASVSGTTALSTGVWTLVTGVYEATSNPPALKVYVNGVLDGTNAAGIPSTQYNNTGRNVLLGVMINSGWLDGRLDDARIYNTALTAADVQNLFAAAPAGAAAASAPFSGVAVLGSAADTTIDLGTYKVGTRLKLTLPLPKPSRGVRVQDKMSDGVLPDGARLHGTKLRGKVLQAGEFRFTITRSERKRGNPDSATVLQQFVIRIE